MTTTMNFVGNRAESNTASSAVKTSGLSSSPQPDDRSGSSIASRFWDRPVGQKITAIIVFFALVFAAIGGFGAIVLWRTGNSLQHLDEISGVLQKNLHDVRYLQINGHFLVRQAALASDPAPYLAQISENDAAIAAAVNIIDGYDEVKTQTWEDFHTQRDDWRTLRDQTLIPLIESGNDAEVYKILSSDPAADPYKVAELVHATQQGIDDEVHDLIVSDEKLITTTIIVLVVAFLVGLVVALLLAAKVSRRITGDLSDVVTALNFLERGDLTHHTDKNSNDEIGRMVDSFTAAQSTLRSVVSNVISGARTVNNSSGSISAGNSQVLAASENTSSQADIVASAAAQINQSIQTVAAGAEEMEASIHEISQNATEAARVADSAVSEAQQTAQSVRELGDTSQEISVVVRTITSIAEQTNLLALNATIEAARAGEAGKGFAVVASEVKDLASESARAAEDVSDRIAQVQAQTANVVESISRITEIINQINDYQMTIASAVEEQTATTNEMSRSVAEAATGTDQIAQNITGVADSAGQANEAVTAMSQTVSTLTDVAATLRRDVEKFTV